MNTYINRAVTIKQNFKKEENQIKLIDGVWYAFGIFLPNSPDYPHSMMITRETEPCPDTGHVDVYNDTIEVQLDTLSISFSDMKNIYNEKVFASLSENCKGSDVLVHPDNYIFSLKYSDMSIKGVIIEDNIKDIQNRMKPGEVFSLMCLFDQIQGKVVDIVK